MEYAIPVEAIPDALREVRAMIEKRLQHAAAADLAMAFYNPRSKSRPEGFVRLLQLLRTHCEPQRLLVFARAVSTPEEHLHVCTLAEATPDWAASFLVSPWPAGSHPLADLGADLSPAARSMDHSRR